MLVICRVDDITTRRARLATTPLSWVIDGGGPSIFSRQATLRGRGAGIFSTVRLGLDRQDHQQNRRFMRGAA